MISLTSRQHAHMQVNVHAQSVGYTLAHVLRFTCNWRAHRLTKRVKLGGREEREGRKGNNHGADLIAH